MKRPKWCPYSKGCVCLMNTQEKMCTGKLLIPEKHIECYNTHRLCLSTEGKEWWVGIKLNDYDASYLKKHLDLVLNEPPVVVLRSVLSDPGNIDISIQAITAHKWNSGLPNIS